MNLTALIIFLLVVLSSFDFCVSGSWFSVGDWGPRHWVHEWCVWLGWCTSVCYDDLGCFDDRLTCHKDFFPPMSPREIQTTFRLYTRKNQKLSIEEIIDRPNKTKLHHSTFRARFKTVFIIHGWGEFGKKSWVMAMKDALLKKDKFNVFVVDWYEGADELNYWKSAQNIRVVGREVAVFVHFLSKVTGIELSSVHLIGHSLGAHAAGYAGEHIEGIGRITALDAAGPAFEDTPDDCRLDKTDAIFVDAIHTDIAANITGGAGIVNPIGHVDFYPNGGYNQPGCYWWQFTCSHSRSYVYFTESLVNKRCSFKGIQCSNNTAFERGLCLSCKEGYCANMGYDAVESKAWGKFYLATKKRGSFCAKKKNYMKLYERWKIHSKYATLESVRKR